MKQNNTILSGWKKGSEYNVETGTDDRYKKLGSTLRGDNYPIVGISWHDASAYCDWLSKKNGFHFKLPTEAQWEKAARGTDGRKYPWGNHEPYHNGKWYANCRPYGSWEKRGEDGALYTAPVGSYLHGSSPYGLLDMAGNVWEWCSDWYDLDYYKNALKNNPAGPVVGYGRVVRGISWRNWARYLRCANRGSGGPSYRNDYFGFRLRQDRIIGE